MSGISNGRRHENGAQLIHDTRSELVRAWLDGQIMVCRRPNLRIVLLMRARPRPRGSNAILLRCSHMAWRWPRMSAQGGRTCCPEDMVRKRLSDHAPVKVVVGSHTRLPASRRPVHPNLGTSQIGRRRCGHALSQIKAHLHLCLEEGRALAPPPSPPTSVSLYLGIFGA